MPRVAKVTSRSRRPKASSAAYDVDGSRQPLRLPPAPPWGWHARTRRQWRTLTSAPWVGLLQESDMVLLETWALLRDAMNRALDAAEPQTASIARLSAECRAIETSIGANPRSRAALAWQATDHATAPGRLASVRSIPGGAGQMSDDEHAALLQKVRAQRGSS